MLEVIVVLVILALMSAVAFPQLATMFSRVEFAMNRESFEQYLAQLPYQAIKQRQDMILATTDFSEEGADGPLAIIVPGVEEQARGPSRVQLPALALAPAVPLMPGWKLAIERPIVYRTTGFCSGGELTLKVGASSYEYELSAPHCRPILR